MSNYREHFGLTQRVFKRDKEAFLYTTDQMRHAEQEFRAAFDENDCVVTVSGPIGSGKTTIVNHALAGLPGETRTVRLGRVRLAPDEVIELLLSELGVAEPPRGTIRKLGALGHKVDELRANDTRLVVVVEDAARTGVDTLAELEVICGSDGGFDIGLVVCGDETLPGLLKGEHLRRLAQRVSANILVAPLAVDEMENYLLSAIRGAGGDPSRMLSNDVPALLHILSCGIPRLANKLVEAAFKKAAAQSAPRVSCSLLADIAEAQFGITTEIPVKRRPAPAAANVGKPDAKPATRAPSPRDSGNDAVERVKSDANGQGSSTTGDDEREPLAAPVAEAPVVEKPQAERAKTESKPGVDDKPAEGGSDDVIPPTLDAEPDTAPAASTVQHGGDQPVQDTVSDPTPPPAAERDAGQAGATPDGAVDERPEPAKDARQDEAKADDDLPYLIQDTQPELVALTPESTGMDSSVASGHEHEMLPDLDELAAELAASNPEPAAAGIPELDDIPELSVETFTEASRTPAAKATPDVPAVEPELPVVEPEARAAEPDVPGTDAALGPADNEPVPDVPELRAEAHTPVIEPEPEPTDVETESTASAAEALSDLPELNPGPGTPDTLAKSAPKRDTSDDMAETTPDEAALISALADEHATSERDQTPAGSPDQGTVEPKPSDAIAETAASTDAAAEDDQSIKPQPSDAAAETPAATDAASDAPSPPKDAVVVPEPELETVAEVNDEAANGEQDPSLQLEVLDDSAAAPADEPTKDEVVVHDADRDPTLAQLKPDLDALELALAENFVPEDAVKAEPEDSEASAEPVPEITLDDSIEEKVVAETEELAKREAEIAARKEAAEKQAPKTGKPGPSDSDVHKLAAELRQANSLEDMDDRLAETLFGDEINMVASQVLKAAREKAESAGGVEAPKPSQAPAPAAAPTPKPTPTPTDDANLKKQFEDVWGEVPDESEAIDLKSVKPNSGLDMSASQRLATVRALNAGMGRPPPAPARKAPAKPKDAPVPIEDQIDISMTNTMKALNIDPKVLEQPAEEEEAPKGGFFSRFRKKG